MILCHCFLRNQWKNYFGYFIYFMHVLTSSKELSLLQAEQFQLSHPVFTGEVFHPSGRLPGTPVDLLQQVHVLSISLS